MLRAQGNTNGIYFQASGTVTIAYVKCRGLTGNVMHGCNSLLTGVVTEDSLLLREAIVDPVARLLPGG